MLSKFRKVLKFAPQLFTVFGALSIAFALLLSVVNLPVMANGGVVNWEGNGSNNLPCVNGVAQWNFSGGQNVTSAVLTVNGQNYGMSQTGGVWKAQVPGLSTVSEAYVTYTGDLGNGNSVLTISHCTLDETPDPTNTSVPPTLTPSNTPTNTPVAPTFTPSNTPTNTAIPDDPDPTQTPGGPIATNTPTDIPTATPTNTIPPATPTETVTEEPKDPGPTGTPVTDETPNPTEPPVTDETPDPTQPPVTDETPEPTLAPPVSNDPPSVLIPVTGIELGGNSPLSDAQNFIFNMGLSFLGLGLVLQSLRKRFNF